MKTEIRLFDLEERTLRIPNGYELNPRGRLARLQQWLWDKARRIGIVVQSIEDKISYRRVVIDDKRPLSDHILKAIDAVYNFNHTPTEILMGPATYRELMKEPMIRDTDCFSHPVLLGHVTNKMSLFNLELHVLPWMEGMLVR